jgi:hypothetical protein
MDGLGKLIVSAFKLVEIVPRMFIALGEGVADIIEGTAMEVVGAVEGTGTIIGDMITMAIYTSVFLFTYLMCFIKGLGNFKTCAPYYLAEIIGQILYLVPRIILFILGAFGFDSVGIEKRLWDWMEQLSDWTYVYLGFYLTHFPKDIRNKCYNCRRLKASAFVNKATYTIDDFLQTFDKDFLPGLQKIGSGAEPILSIFE